MKSNGVFKSKHLSIIIIEAYPIIFHRKFPQDAETITNTLPYYHNRVLETEKKIFKALYCDIFIPDISYLPLIPIEDGFENLSSMSTPISSSTPPPTRNEIDDIKKVTILLTTFLYRIGSKTIEIQIPHSQTSNKPLPTTQQQQQQQQQQQSILCHEGLKILPFDLIQWACSLIGCILQTFLKQYYIHLEKISIDKKKQLSSPPSYLQSPQPQLSPSPSSFGRYQPLNQPLIFETLDTMSFTTNFILFYLNARRYYPTSSSSINSTHSMHKTNTTHSNTNTPIIGSSCLNTSVSLISYFIQSILSSSEIRTISELLATTPGIIMKSPNSKKYPNNSNSLFGTQQQWKIILALVPGVYTRWIEIIESNMKNSRYYLKKDLITFKTRELTN